MEEQPVVTQHTANIIAQKNKKNAKSAREYETHIHIYLRRIFNLKINGEITRILTQEKEKVR